MKKHRVILILFSLVLIVVLYFLPRIVVDNQPDQQISGSVPPSEEHESPSDPSSGAVNLHAQDMSAGDRARSEALKLKINNEEDDIRALADSLSAIFIAYNQFDSAAKYLDIVAESYPGKEAYEKAGNAYYDALGFAMEKEKANVYSEKARHYFDLLLSEDGSRLDIKNKLAMTYVSTSSPMQGIALLREILEADPENEDALFNLGILSVQSGQYERAGERFKKLVSLYPQNLQGQFYLALCYYELGERENARKQFELVKSLEDDPAVLATIDGYLRALD